MDEYTVTALATNGPSLLIEYEDPEGEINEVTISFNWRILGKLKGLMKRA